ncbi:hypothetical protein [Maliponia aquimaris]|uniref:hypothetical protein n=1 Tax=Maliponia aquimaris TaxID=1673631 RepID=UPI0011400681|nr:hypothetical protein [Maliponia aquimaris]
MILFDVVDAEQPQDPPLLRIYADGQLRVRLRGDVLDGGMSREALATLLHDIVVTGKLAEIDGSAIREALTQVDQTPQKDGTIRLGGVMADAPTSFLRVDLPDCRFDVQVFGSALSARQHPDVAPLQRFRQIEVQLLEIVTQVQTR